MVGITERTVRTVFAVLIALDVLFIAATGFADVSEVVTANRFAQVFDLKREGNVAVWYSSVLLLLAAAHAFAITGSPHAARNGRLFRPAWTVIGLAFLWLSMDETASIHEQSGMLFTKLFGRIPGLTDASGHGVFAWLLIWLPGIVLFVAAMLAITRAWLSFHPPSRRLALAAVGCWIGVLFSETMQARLLRVGNARSIEGVIEEGLEIVGTMLFLVSFHVFLTAPQPGCARRGVVIVHDGLKSPDVDPRNA
ncbi:MAG TPA: hypothetical protein VN428_24190 [Bryobacteraceae bacterium]|nr:hypothetical protein [Bryobacteraceae bacterium]